VAAPDISQILNDLLSTHILTEWQSSPADLPEQYVLTFAHHVLFDYAVARLLFRGTPEKLLRRLSQDPELVIVVRPSLVLHFQYMWTIHPGREQFWRLVLQIMHVSQIPEIGKLIGPAIAAELSRALPDLAPLCTALASPEQGVRTAADQALRHLTGSLLAATPTEYPLVGSEAGPWCDLLEWVSQHLREPLTSAMRPLLVTLCEHPERFTPAQRIAAGTAARRLLEFAWTMAPQDPWLVAHAIQAVCRTFEGDSVASALLLRRCLEPIALTQYGYKGMRYLAQEVERLIPLDAALVAEIYRTAFTHQEPSTEPTPIGLSRILPMTSNRQQDCHMVLYVLANVFPVFLAQAPAQATRTLMVIIGLYVAQKHHHAASEREEPFVFHENETYIRTDYSANWDTGAIYDNDEPLKMLGAFESYVERLAEQEENAGELYALIAIVAEENRLAVVWRRLLRLGARFPHTLGRTLLPLAWTIPVLKHRDTSEAAGTFLHAIFPELTTAARERVERALLALPEFVPSDRREAGEHIRNRLLGCLMPSDLITNEARHLLTHLQAANAVPPNEPPVRVTSWTGNPFGEEEYLAEEGVPVNAEANQRIRDLEQPVKTFADQQNARSLSQIINTIGTESYFASGAYALKQQQHTADRKPLTQEQERFYREAGPLLDLLADVGFPSVAHHLLELLEVFIPCDAAGIFLRIGRVIRGGKKSGYQYESLAVDLMVGLVERYLAEYRPLLREQHECRQTLLDILDTFVQVGWPQARRLAYRLEEIYQ
jgi:hypothetical protein